MMQGPGSAAEAADKAIAAWKTFTDGIERSMIRRALDAAGYSHEQPTRENLVNCFSDYVDAGVWADLTLEDIEGLSVSDMCRALNHIRW